MRKFAFLENLYRQFILFIALLLLQQFANAQPPVPGINVNGAPAALGDTIRVCRGNFLTYTSTATGYTTINWQFHLGTPATSASPAPPAILYNIVGIDSTIQITSNGTDTVYFYIIIKVTDVHPVIDFIHNNNVCSGTAQQFNPVVSGTAPYTYGWSFGNGITSNISSPVTTFTSLGCGTAIFNNTLTVTDATGCSSTITRPITLLQAPDVELQDPDPNSPFSNCENSPTPGNPNFTLTVNNISPSAACITTYSVNWGDGNSISPATFPLNHTYTQIGAFNLVVTALSSNGCTSSKTYIVANQTNPAGSLGTLGTTTNLCAPATVPFTITNWQINSIGTLYILNFGDGTSVTLTHPLNPGNTTDTIYHTYTTSSCPAGAYNASLNVINACGSTPYTAGGIRVLKKAESAFTVAATSYCVGQSVCFNNTTTAGAGVNCSTASTTTWDFGDGSPPFSGVTPPCHSYSSPGTYTVTLTTTNYCGASVFSMQICITKPPIPGFNLDNIAGCAPVAVTATNTTTSLNNCTTASYFWTVTYTAGFCGTSPSSNFTNGTNATSANPSFVFNNSGVYTITLAVTNACGTFITSKTVTVKKPPVVTLTPFVNVCAPATVTPVATVMVCDTGTVNYSWTFTGGTPNTSTSQNPGPITYNSTGTFNISLTATNACGTTTATTPLNVLAAPIADAGIDKTICSNGSTQLGAAPVAGLTYSWFPATGLVTATIANPILTLYNPGSTPLVFTYVLTVTNSNNCSTKDTVLVTVNPLPVVAVTPSSAAICIGGTTQLTANGADTYSWSPAIGLSAITGSTVTANPVITTTYTVSGTITATGCNKSTTITVTVNPLPVVNAGSDQAFCNQPIPVQLTGSPAGGIWSGPNITAGGVFTPNGTGVFSVVYTFTNANNCTNTDTAVITVIDPTTVNAGSDMALCLNSGNLQFTGSPAGGIWSGTNITAGGLFTPSLTGTFNIVYSIGAGTCLTRDTAVVTVNPLPVVSINPTSVTICIGNTTHLTASGADTYLWSPAIGLSAITGSTVTANPVITTTYTVTGTITTTGCNKSATVTVIVNPLPVVNAGLDQTLCNQPIPVLLTGAPAGGIWSGPNITAGGVFTPGGTGVFSVVYTYTNGNNCINTDTAVITVVPVTIPNAGPDIAFCLNSGNFQFTGSPSGGTWSGTNITAGGLFSPVLAGTFNLVYSIGTSTCLKWDTVVVTVNPLPVVSVNPSSVSICIGNTTQLTAIGADTYLWSPAAGLSATTGTTVTANPVVTTTYTVTGTVTATGCNKSATVTVTVNQDSRALFTGNPTLHCAPFDLSTAITVTPFPDRNGQYKWYANGSLIATNTTGAFPAGYTIPTPGTTVIIKLVTTSQYGCKPDSMEIPFTTVTTAIANFTKTPANGCGPLTVTFTNTSNIINTPIQYFWNFGNLTSLTTTNPGPVTATYLSDPNFGIATYYITLKAYNGCDTTYHYDSVKVFPNSKARFGVDTTRGCSPFIVHITNISPGNNFNYYWDFGDNTRDTTHSLGSFPHTYNPGVITTYTITLISENQCTRDTQMINLVVSPNSITALLNANGNEQSGCAPHTVTFINGSTGASQLTWNWGDGTPLQTTPNQSAITHLYNNPGNYTVIIHLLNDCSDTMITRNVTVYAPPVSNFMATPTRVCTNQSVTVTNTSTNANSSEIYWGDAPSYIPISTSLQHTYNNPGLYTIILVAKRVNPSGFVCTDTIRRQITVVNKIPAQITVAPGNQCVPYTLNVNAGNISGYSNIEWVIYDNSTPPGVFHITGLSASHIYNVAGTDSVRLIVYTTAGCVDSTTYQFQVFNTPQTTFNPKLITTCSHDTTVTFTAVTTSNGNNPVTYKWFINGSIQGTSNPFSYHFQAPLNNTAPVEFTVQALAVNAAGCGDTSLAGKVIIQTLPRPNIDVSPSLIQYQPFYTFTFKDTVATNPNKTYNWDMGDAEKRNGREVTHTYGDIGTYKVSLLVTDFTTGCKAKDSVRVTILYVPGSLYVPNAFYPNSRKNELKAFLPAGIGLEKYHLQIFDAWGKLIFETKELNPDGSPKVAWDGSFNASNTPNSGKPLTQDAYVWKIVEAKFKNGKDWEGMSYNESPPKRFGTLTLFR